MAAIGLLDRSEAGTARPHLRLADMGSLVSCVWYNHTPNNHPQPLRLDLRAFVIEHCPWHLVPAPQKT